MEGAQLRGANLEDAIVAGNLVGTDFSAARLVRADLSGPISKMRCFAMQTRNRPIFRRATCTPRISAARLVGTSFRGANLRNAVFYRCRHVRCCFHKRDRCTLAEIGNAGPQANDVWANAI